MRKALIILVSVGLAALAGSIVLSGNLEPPASPAPTMVTLQQIYDKLASQVGVVRLAKTGQTGCWDPVVGTGISCTGTGQDGEYQAGVSVSPRFTDNGNGTVTDNLTGFIWLQDAVCAGFVIWRDALSFANGLASASDSCIPDLTDGSVAGDWRLPNVKELQSLIDYRNTDPALPTGHPFTGVESYYYWSSTGGAREGPDRLYYSAWFVDLRDGRVENRYCGSDAPSCKGFTPQVWPVRGGK